MGDDGEWTLEKVMEWMSSSKSRKGKPENKMFLKLLSSFSGDEKPGPGSGDDGDYESVPYETVQVYEGYEERRYPSVNFACTQLTYEMPEDNDDGEWTLEKVMEWMSSS